MSKKFKLKIYNVLPSSLQLCRTKDVPISPEKHPRRPVYGLTSVKPKSIDIAFPSPTPLHASPENRHARRKNSQQSSSSASSSPEYPSWVQEASKFRVLAGARSSNGSSNIYGGDRHRGLYFDAVSHSFDSSCCDDEDLSPFYETKKVRDKSRLSSMCNKNDEEENALIDSALNFSTDSSSYDYDQSLDVSISEVWSKSNIKRFKKLSRSFKGLTSSSSKPTKGSLEFEIPVKGSVLFRRMMLPCAVAESVAVVKKSKDPLEDFKRSMLEMILEKQMFDANDLEQLLQCFLTLNSKQYHGVIVAAFTEIWEILFSDNSTVMMKQTTAATET